MQLAEKLQILRKMNQYTQQDIADKLYVSRQTVQKWEAGISSPDLYKIPEIAKLFSITADDLLDESLDEKNLLTKVLLPKEKVDFKEKDQLQAKSVHSALDWLIIIPALVGLFILIFMGYTFGAIIVSITYFIAGASSIWGVYSIINTFLNISNGIGAILVSIGFAFLGIGLMFPAFISAKWLLNWYKKLCTFLTNYIKDKSILKGVFHHEK